MSETTETLRSKLVSVHDLGSVVQTMKALAAANIGRYERAVRSLADYYRTVELALAAWFHASEPIPSPGQSAPATGGAVGAVIFGSDLGLVGRFNEDLADYVARQVPSESGKNRIWASGERMRNCLENAGLPPLKFYATPSSVFTITPLVTQLLTDIEGRRMHESFREILVFHNRPGAGASYEPVHNRLLPLDRQTVSEWSRIPWPTPRPPEVLARGEATLVSLIREHLFVSLFRASAESLASENASRLAAMQRAEQNIKDLGEELTRIFNQARQTSIDEELLDLWGGFAALSPTTTKIRKRQQKGRI